MDNFVFYINHSSKKKAAKRTCDFKMSRFLPGKSDSFVLLRNNLCNDQTLPESFSYGEGPTIQFQTNIYPITPPAQEVKFYQYIISTNPIIYGPKHLSQLIENTFSPLTHDTTDSSKVTSFIFDGLDYIFSSLPDLEGERSVPDTKDPSKNILIKTKLVKEIDSNDIEGLVHIYQTVLSKAYLSVGLTQFGKKWLNDQDIKKFGNFKIIDGFKPSIVALSTGICLVVDSTFRIDRQGNVYDYLKHGISNPNERNDLVNSLKEMDILTSYSKDQQHVRISIVDWVSDPSQVERKEQQSISDYFQQVHNITVQRDDPLVSTITFINGEQRNDLIPASCLTITGLTEAEKRDEKFMQDLHEVITIPIEAQKEKLDQFIMRMQKDPEISSMFSQWGIEIGESIQCDGKVVPPPKLMFRTRQTDHAEYEIQLNSRLNFRNELRYVGVAVPPYLISPPLIIAPSQNLLDVKEKFVPRFLLNSSLEDGKQSLVQELGIHFQPPNVIEIENTNPNSYRRKILEYILEHGGAPSFIIMIYPDSSIEKYDSVQQLLAINLGIPYYLFKSSLLKFDDSKTSKQVLMQATHKLLYTLCAKTGGICYYPSPYVLPLEHTMVIGISLEKPKLMERDIRVCSMAASYDNSFGRFYSDTFLLSRNKDRSRPNEDPNVVPSDHLSNFIQKAVDKYCKLRNSPPKRIVVYRNCMSYNHMKRIKQEEVKAITDMVDSSTSVAYIMVQDNCNIRLMMSKTIEENEEEDIKQETVWTNPPPGTIVTGKIGSVGLPEFYLVSRDTTQEPRIDPSFTAVERQKIFDDDNCSPEMATPTKYTIIHHFPAVWEDDQLTKLTHYLTCIYPNYPGSIRIPVPLMYAAKLAEFTKTRLNMQKANDSLSGFLHFL